MQDAKKRSTLQLEIIPRLTQGTLRISPRSNITPEQSSKPRKSIRGISGSEINPRFRLAAIVRQNTQGAPKEQDQS